MELLKYQLFTEGTLLPNLVKVNFSALQASSKTPAGIFLCMIKIGFKSSQFGYLQAYIWDMQQDKRQDSW